MRFPVRFALERLWWMMSPLSRKGVLLFVPAALVFIVFYYWPLLVNTALSFFSWNMVSPNLKFVGLANYAAVLQSRESYQVLGNTLLFILFLLVFNFVLPYIYSYIMAHMLQHGRKVYRFLLFLPSLLSLAVASILFLWIYNPIAGPIHEILQLFGLASPQWSSKTWALSNIIYLT